MRALLLAAVLAPSAFCASELLFRASFDSTATADMAAGDREPTAAGGLTFEAGAVRVAPGGKAVYDARANLYAEQGTVSFWWRPDEPAGRAGFSIFQANHEQRSIYDYGFVSTGWSGSRWRAQIRDRALRDHAIQADAETPAPGKWFHLALTWSEPDGLALYVDGKLAGRAPGPLDLDARIDQFAFLARSVSAQSSSGTENAGSIDEARVYGAPLAAADVARLAARQEPAAAVRAAPRWMERFGWSAAAAIPEGSSFTVRRVPVRHASVVKKFWLKGVDGKRETVWPMPGHEGGYLDDEKRYTVELEDGGFNLLRTTGDLAARVSAGGAWFARPGGRELHYQRLDARARGARVELERQSGTLGDLECLDVRAGEEPPQGPWMQFAPGADPGFAGRRHPATIAGWTEGRATSTAPAAGPRYHYFTIPTAADVSLSKLRLRVASRPGAYYWFAIADPVDASRLALEFDARATAERLGVTFEWPPLIVPAGKALTFVVASSDAAPVRMEAQIVPGGMPKAAHVGQRILQVRDLFQLLSEARPWMRVGAEIDRAALLRQAKVVGQLIALLEDVRRIDPGNATASAYWSWIHFNEPPPGMTEPATPPGVPRWAAQQLRILKQFHGVVEWWIDRRQIANGEFGGGLADDSDLIQNWPAVALFDGPSEKIRRSARLVQQACWREGMVKDGLNTRRMDPLHAYEEGVNAIVPSFVLDYGNPVLFEEMMATARHYGRLTGVNAAGHRHFRSYSFSATDMIEDGRWAREDSYSHILLQPGLWLAWYNGSAGLVKLMREVGDSLLAHWTKETYPRIATRILFATDQADARSAPGLATFNLMWGLYDLTGDDRYLWLLRQALRAGDAGRAGTVNGAWTAAASVPADLPLHPVDGHNLQADATGLMSRVLAWLRDGEPRHIEESHAALWRHMAQNAYLYTEAEQFSDRIWIPTLSVQRERMGGIAHYRNQTYPGMAVSWEGTGGEVAALVPVARKDALRMVAVNAGAAARTVVARVWQLENGRYEATVKGEDGAVMSKRSLALKRYSALPLVLPARKTVTVEVRQTAQGTPLWRLPDLAIAAEEMESEGPLSVPVHNIGGAASRSGTVEVRDAGGNLLASAPFPALAAPDDLRPKVFAAKFPSLRRAAGMRIAVRQDGNGEEICDENNRAALR